MSAHELTTATQPIAARLQRSAGRHLTLVGVTPDGKRLRLADPRDPDGSEFTVEIDARLRAALGIAPERRPDRRSGTVETKMESMLRPRDIQARIRAGETPEAVAAAAQTTVEKVMPYAAPVLAEREHVAQRAQRSSIRRPANEPQPAWHSPARTLGDAVTAHLHSRNVDPELVTWDAWRREDGRWQLVGRYSIQGHDGLAELTFDQPGNFVTLDNEESRWLVGDLPDPLPTAAAQDEPEPGVRRLSAVPEGQLTLGDELLGDELLGNEALGGEPLGNDVLGLEDQPLEAFLDDQPGVDETELREEAADAAALDDEGEDEPSGAPAPGAVDEHEPPSRRPVKKTRGRASVPSWDEIMFGGPGDGDRA